MKEILIVGVGGFVGAALRYKIGELIQHYTTTWKFAAGTFFVNVCGCLVAGMLMALAAREGYFSPTTKLLLFTGLLGGFTTFSAFGVDTVTLLQRSEPAWAACYVGLTVFVGIFALWFGMVTVR